MFDQKQASTPPKGAEKITLGKGAWRYEWAEGWGALPSGVEFGYTHGIAVDRQDRTFVFNRSRDAVIIFDKHGKFLGSWGAEFAQGAHGLTLNAEGGAEYLYLTDSVRSLIVKTTLDGAEIFRIGTPELPEIYGKDRPFHPTQAAVAPNGDIYVCDGYGQSWIHHYDKFGERLASWGGKGAEAGKFDCPHGISVDTRGSEPLLYVADRANHRVQIFTLAGEFVRMIVEEIDYPCSFYERGGELYIPDLHSRVTILDAENRLITHLSDDQTAWRKADYPNIPLSERKPGSFVAPHAVCVDSENSLYVAEWIVNGRLTKLVRI